MNDSARSRLSLDTEVQYLPGVGPRRAKQLSRLGVSTVCDLLEYLPHRHERHQPSAIEDLQEGMIATIVGEVRSVSGSYGRRGRATRAKLIDNTGVCELCWFNAGWMRDRLKSGECIRATGRVGVYRDLAQLVNPRIERLGRDAEPIDDSAPPTFEGVYPATAEMPSSAISRIIRANLDHMLPLVGECHPEERLRLRDLPPRQWAMSVVHRPEVEADVEKARRRLAYDELLLLQLAVFIARKAHREGAKAQPLKLTPEIDARIRARFPFELTNGQSRAARIIADNMQRDVPMNRLLQGDVGCGKTVVALYAALTAVANGRQVAIMAPTELLAEQHYRSIEKYLEGSRVRNALLLGRLGAAERRKTLKQIEAGEIDIVIGTHALIQGDVRFDQLGLVIIDEQHRFGVRQRATIRSKGLAPHYLVMTATPIPRTLAMTVFGDLDVTTIEELPPGRSGITTRVVGPDDQSKAWRQVEDHLSNREQAYVVYPLVDESDKLEMKAATTEYKRLSESVFADRRVGLVHGRLKSDERDSVMRSFALGELDVLVATTVIEVGIDVPNATCIVIEHAERYGLSQLHQLRGRVGRGKRPGHCFLMSDSPAVEENRRLSVLAETTDGFKIAEADLRLRGPGEMLGTRQHGLPELRVANLINDQDLLRMAQQDADEMIRTDPRLLQPENRALRSLLLAKYRDVLNLLTVG